MINMQAPPEQPINMTPSGRIILTRNTGVEVRLDVVDFHAVKDVAWYEVNGEIVNRTGITLISYLEIQGARKGGLTKYDLRRKNFA